MELRTIQDHWGHFEQRDIAPSAPDVQRTEMRRSFAAGAASGVALALDAIARQEPMTDMQAGRLQSIMNAIVDHGTWPMLTPGHAEELARHAFRIADDSMYSQVECEALRLGDGDSRLETIGLSQGESLFALVDEDGVVVQSLDDASEAIRDAFGWLGKRDLARLVRDTQGECIVLGQRGT